MPYTTVVAGTVITASWGNANVRDQVVTPFGSAAARTSAVTAPIQGMVSTLTDIDTFEAYDGTNWVAIASWASWDTYNPTWGSSGSAPSIGNGTLVGRYQKFGRSVKLFIRLTWGSTTSGGTGNWTFTLPSDLSLDNTYMGGFAWDNSVSLTLPVASRMDSGAATVAQIGAHTSAGTGALITATHPFTWATSDELSIGGVYQSNT
jgi:hypothetical protein